MFTTPEEVMAVTPYEGVSMENVRQAQYVIEAYVGRVEGEIESSRDLALLGRATIFQTVYMLDNPDITFNQIKTSMVSSAGQMTAFNDDYSPFVAPLAALTCKHLTWRKSRSVNVGRFWQRKTISPLQRWATE